MSEWVNEDPEEMCSQKTLEWRIRVLEHELASVTRERDGLLASLREHYERLKRVISAPSPCVIPSTEFNVLEDILGEMRTILFFVSPISLLKKRAEAQVEQETK